MKRVGIIGGMSYESTLRYYERINRQVNERAGGLTSADLVLRSVNFEEYYRLIRSNQWEEVARRLGFMVLDLVLKDRCDYVAIASNTMHRVADKVAGPYGLVNGSTWPPVSTMVDIPLIHIGDCVATECRNIGAKQVLMLGTKCTMTEDFMRKRFRAYGVSIMDTSNYLDEIDEINRIIFNELCHGIVTANSAEFMLNFISQFPSDKSGVRPEAVILGCTELGMILRPDDIDIPLIDSAQAHIDRIVERCLMN